MKNTLAQLDMLLVNRASATILPENVPAFTAFMKMKNERSANFQVENGLRIPKINKLKDYLWIASMYASKCFILLQIYGIN